MTYSTRTPPMSRWSELNRALKCVARGVLAFLTSLNLFLYLDGGHEPWGWPTTLMACVGTVLVAIGVVWVGWVLVKWLVAK